MGHRNKRSLHQQAYDRLQSMCGYGRSKKQDKILGISNKYIYSFSSMQSYQKHINYFLTWCKSNPVITEQLGHRARTLEEVEPYIEPYIRAREEQGLSAYTVKLELSALAKLYNKTFNIITIGTRRQDITRSRLDSAGDKHFSEEKNRDMIDCCRCVGFRRSELEKAKAEDLIQRNGVYYMKIVGKGGRYREAMLCGTAEEIQRAIAYIHTLNGHNHVHSNADIHSYRADYATRIYNTYARDITTIQGTKINYTELTGKTDRQGNTIYKNGVYYCRGDQKGMSLDRTAMIIASQNLGHNRESVVGEHYIRIVSV